MATLLAYFVTRHQGYAIPKSRRQLLEQSILVLLRCGHRVHGEGIGEPEAARRLLAALSLWLHELPEEGFWPQEQLVRTLSGLLIEQGSLAKNHWRQLWEGPEKFLELVKKKTGLLAPRDGSNKAWQFLHRQFHELLAAQALDELAKAQAEKGNPNALLDFVKQHVLGNGQADISRWAEVLGYACEVNQEPLKVLAELARLDGELALRILPELEGVDPVAALEALGNAEWDGDFPRKLVARWIEGGSTRRTLSSGFGAR